MSDIKHYDEIFQTGRSPGGLQATFAYLLTSLLSDSDIRKEIVKDVNRMADVMIFFSGNQAVLEILMPWASGDREELTRRWQHLLSTRECGHLKNTSNCQPCLDVLTADIESLKKDHGL